MEMPVSACQKMPEDFELKSTKKGFQRYWSAKSPKLLDQLVTAEEKREAAEKDATRRVFELFDDQSVQTFTIESFFIGFFYEQLCLSLQLFGMDTGCEVHGYSRCSPLP